ncbi:Aldolase-type TIM barrel [Penicillium verhagenii]|uniref:Aldolase-type TIM barrel n=1 Tax=Penicillium verhagenii TaxID=1562060 RepID=UPI0025457BCC|nr:Aldolase-type TIM barrel [Penicillium verhagenii]KAJ5928075.1 Aldolase-type TIM barrel [Penicillium verhagenii]
MGQQDQLLQKWFPHTTAPLIANAPMFGFADYNLAVAVTKAGGLGFIGGGFDFSSESSQLTKLNDQLEKARAELGATASKNLPIGVGFITFKPAGFIENVIPLLQSHRVAAIWLSFPESDADHLPLIEGIRQARTKNDWEVKIFVQTGTVRAALKAVKQGADAVVVQGSDAGGHQWAQGASLISLLPEVRDSFVENGVASHTAILAAGGIADGRGCVAALGLGADGVVMGTRFIATAECPAPPTIKQAILSGSDGAASTVKSTKHDVFQSTDVFPRQYDGRAVIGISFDEFKSGASDDEIIQRYNDAMKNGEDYRRTVWAGASIGVIKEELTVSELVKGVQNEVKSVMNRLIQSL